MMSAAGKPKLSKKRSACSEEAPCSEEARKKPRVQRQDWENDLESSSDEEDIDCSSSMRRAFDWTAPAKKKPEYVAREILNNTRELHFLTMPRRQDDTPSLYWTVKPETSKPEQKEIDFSQIWKRTASSIPGIPNERVKPGIFLPTLPPDVRANYSSLLDGMMIRLKYATLHIDPSKTTEEDVRVSDVRSKSKMMKCVWNPPDSTGEDGIQLNCNTGPYILGCMLFLVQGVIIVAPVLLEGKNSDTGPVLYGAGDITRLFVYKPLVLPTKGCSVKDFTKLQAMMQVAMTKMLCFLMGIDEKTHQSVPLQDMNKGFFPVVCPIYSANYTVLQTLLKNKNINKHIPPDNDKEPREYSPYTIHTGVIGGITSLPRTCALLWAKEDRDADSSSKTIKNKIAITIGTSTYQMPSLVTILEKAGRCADFIENCIHPGYRQAIKSTRISSLLLTKLKNERQNLHAMHCLCSDTYKLAEHFCAKVDPKSFPFLDLDDDDSDNGAACKENGSSK